MTASRSVSMNSNTRCKFPLCGNASINSTMFGSLSSFSSLISLRAVKFTPSFRLPSRIFLIATVCPVCQCNEFIFIRIPHYNRTVIFIIEQKTSSPRHVSKHIYLLHVLQLQVMTLRNLY